jgi:nucleotide-binding universal stress UspA family protein
MKHILVAYDGSAAAAKAFSLALELAEKYGAELRVLAVARPPEFGSEVETEAVIENSKQHYHKILRPLQAVASSQRTVAIHFEVAVGHPAEQIVRHAEDWKADLVVVGHRGRTFFERWLIGSVAKHVINHAPCAVLVAR